MIGYKYFDLFWQGSIDKQWKIEYDGGVIQNRGELFSQSIELMESLCSEQELRFGCCESSCLKFKVANIFTSLINQWLAVSVVVEHHDDAPLMIGRYKVLSDKPTADRKWRDVVAYDALYDILSSDVSGWYNKILPDKESTMTLRQFRESFLQHFGLEWVVPAAGLVNDGMTVERTIDPEQVSGRDVITAICEINGCFGHIGRDGKFHYIYLPQAIEGLYPANDLYPDRAPEYLAQARTGHLYPQNPKGIRIGKSNYISAHYEDFRTRSITMLQIRQQENDIGKVWPDRDIGENDNCYIIQDNFLVYGKSDEQLTEIAQNIYSKITDITYRPFDADCRGNPCLEVGDPVRFNTRYELIESYILVRTLKGLQSLRDNYVAAGEEKYAEKVNGINKSILQLKGKTNILTRTVEETRLEMKDLGDGLSTEISATAGQLRAELANTKEGLSTEIQVTAKGILANVSETYETKIDAGNEYGNIRSSIALESGRITTEIDRASKAEQTLSGQITTTESNLNSKIEQTEAQINLSVSSQITETKTYASTAATNAQNAANAATDNKLKNYSTTTQMNAAINLTAQGITQEVSKTYETKTDAGTQYESLSASITITAEQISQKVSKGSVSSEISQEAGKIAITSDRFSLQSTNCTITEDGTIKAKNCELSGTLKTSKIDNEKIKLDNNYMIFKDGGKIYGDEGLGIEVFEFSGSTLNIGKYKGANYSDALRNVNINVRDTKIGWSESPQSCSAKIYAGGNDGLRIYFTSNSGDFVEIAKKSGHKQITSYNDGELYLGTSSNRIGCIYVKSIAHSANVNGATAGFFGASPVAKQTVSTISSTSSATTSSNATKINEVINALKKYGLL